MNISRLGCITVYQKPFLFDAAIFDLIDSALIYIINFFQFIIPVLSYIPLSDIWVTFFFEYSAESPQRYR